MENWVKEYIAAEKRALDSISAKEVVKLIEKLSDANREGRQIFVFGNGGSGANASHFSIDLAKNAAEAVGKPFMVHSLSNHVNWITAIGNDYSFEDIFARQLSSYAKEGDIAFALSVSGNSPNILKAINFAKEKGLYTIALLGNKGGKGAAGIADLAFVIDSDHYGRAEDTMMTLCHMLCYSFVENAGKPR